MTLRDNKNLLLKKNKKLGNSDAPAYFYILVSLLPPYTFSIPNFMKKTASFFLSLVTILITTNVCWSTDWYVSTAGNDSNSGSAGSPKRTIQAAINAASTGDVINVAAGTYQENVMVTKELTIKGAGKGDSPATNTILTPTSACQGVGFTITASNVTLQQLYLTQYEVAVQISGVARPTLQDMALVDYCQKGINFSGLTTNVTISKTSIQRTSAKASTVGIQVLTTNAVNGMLIDNCLISGNTQGMLVTQSTTPVAFDQIIIQNSTISNNFQKGLYFEKLSNALLSNLTIDNNGTDPNYEFNNGIDINLKYGTYANITLQNSDITNSGANGAALDPQSAAAIAIKARDDAPLYHTLPATLSGVILKNNRIAGPQNGIRFGEFGKINVTPVGIIVEQNDLSFGFTHKALIHRTQGTVTLNCNWHGSTTPSTIRNGFESAGNGTINLNQVLSSGSDQSTDVGFQPVPGCSSMPLTNAILSGEATICAGTSTDIRAVITGGTAPYNLVYSNGSSTFTVNNYSSGQKISVTPTLTTTYTLVSVTDASGATLPSASLNGSALVRVTPINISLINVGQSKSAIKTNDLAAWTSQYISPDAGPILPLSTESNPTIYYSENLNKTAPRFWTAFVETCALGTDGSLTFDMLTVSETGTVRSYNTHENNAPYFMFANRDGFTELYAQNHPAYGFYQLNDQGVNIHDAGFSKGLFKLAIRYWDQKGWGSNYPSTRQPQGTVLAYQEYWFRIQSKDGVGAGALRQKAVVLDNGQRMTDNGAFAEVIPNPITNTLRLKVQESKGQDVQTILLDASGRQVFKRVFVPETSIHHEEFNVSQLSNGVYFLRVHFRDTQTILKVIKVQ